MSDREECMLCGRKGLKRTVHLVELVSGEEVFYGVDCAATVLKQDWRGKLAKVSTEAIKSMAIRAKTDKVILYTKDKQP